METPSPQYTRLRTRLAVSLALLAVLSAGATLLVIYLNMRTQLRQDIRQRLHDEVAIAALQIDGDTHAKLTDPSQEGSVDYLKIKRVLQEIRDSATDIRYVYTVRRNTDGKIVFIVDAEEDPTLFSPLGSDFPEDQLLIKNIDTMNQPLVDETFTTDAWGTWLTGYAPFYDSSGRRDGILGMDIAASNVVAAERHTLWLSLGIFAIMIPFMAGIGWLLGDRLASPIMILTSGVEHFTAGDLSYRVQVHTRDEIKKLADAFNTMADRLRALVTELEQRVAERTKALDRRAIQLQAAADVGAAAARLLNLDELLKQVAQLISQRFNFYHVGIFLLDERGEYAVLRAANSEGGKRMLEHGYKLKVGQVGLVGYVTALAEPRIALDVGKDAVFFDNPDLPQTRSEMALPLLIGDKILGALDIQSSQENAFSEEDISTLRVLADQISIAIDNARLFAERESALETTRRAFGEISRIGWQRLLGGKYADIGYACTADAMTPISGEANSEFLEAIKSGKEILTHSGKILHLPIKTRDEIIGVMRLEKSEDQGQWSENDISMAKTLADQLGAALESARLFLETSRRAARERAVSEITTQLRRTNDPQDMIRTAVEELKRVLGAGEIQIHPYYPGQEEQIEEYRSWEDDQPTTPKF